VAKLKVADLSPLLKLLRKTRRDLRKHQEILGLVEGAVLPEALPVVSRPQADAILEEVEILLHELFMMNLLIIAALNPLKPKSRTDKV